MRCRYWQTRSKYGLRKQAEGHREHFEPYLATRKCDPDCSCKDRPRGENWKKSRAYDDNLESHWSLSVPADHQRSRGRPAPGVRPSEQRASTSARYPRFVFSLSLPSSTSRAPSSTPVPPPCGLLYSFVYPHHPSASLSFPEDGRRRPGTARALEPQPRSALERRASAAAPTHPFGLASPAKSR